MVTSQTVESIFHAALHMEEPRRRTAYLDEVCGDNQALRRRIEALLAADQAGDYLEPSAEYLASTALLPPIGEKPGDVIGPYKLLEQIGEGGMGLVFVAEQSQPLRRRVALKIIKPGLDTRAVVTRFEAERQALALMDHPNIARVYDAGATDSGRPYFVMELVRGAPITDFCHDRNVPLRERLELFIEVCHAVQHAHQKGIIHRDLKPTNILVGQGDVEPVPKVIDFGVAKATSQQLTEHTLYTHFSQIIGTPLYMSPEQADLGNQDVDTRSDVYSLGVVLYELLTGTTPFDAQRLRSAGADEMRRIIREEEPPKPSTRATTDAVALSTLDTKASTPSRIDVAALKGDLDWIVMKALEKDRWRRYESPSAMANDVQRFLDGHPVLARPPSFVDKLAKWSWRHRTLMRATAATLACAFVGLLVASAMLANAAEEASQAAQLATRERDEAFRNLYRANVQIAHFEWSKGRVDRTLQLLEAVEPRPGDEDFRRWEWYYTRSLCEYGTLLRGTLLDSQPDSPERLYSRSEAESSLVVDHQGEVRLATTDEIEAGILCRRGRTLVAIAGPRIRVANDLVAFDLESRKESWRRSFTPTASVLAVSPDGEQVVVGTTRGEFVVHSVKDGKLLRHLQGTENFGWAGDITWSSSGKFIVACGGGGELLLWSAATGQVLRRWSDANIGETSATWSAVDLDSHDQRIVAAGQDRLQVWALDSDQPTWTIAAHRGHISDVAWSPDGKSIASSGLADNFVKCWNAETGELENEYRGHTAMISSVVWIDHGRQLASSAENGVTRVWERDDRQQNTPLPAAGAVAWTPSGKIVARGSGDGPRQLHLYSLAAPDKPEPISDNDRSYNDILCLAVDSANKRLATGHEDGMLRLWDMETGAALREIRVYSEPVRCVQWRPDGSKLATSGGSAEDGFRVIDAQSGEVLQRLRIVIDRDTRHGSLAWSPDGSLLAGYRTRDVCVWRTDNWSRVHHLITDDGGNAYAQGVAWSPRGDRFACCTGELVTIWDATTGRQTLCIRAHYRETNSLAWSPDGTRLATGGDDHLIKLWDAKTGDDMLTLEGHSSIVPYLSWSPDGRNLASSDGTNVFIWDATRGYAPF